MPAIFLLAVAKIFQSERLLAFDQVITLADHSLVYLLQLANSMPAAKTNDFLAVQGVEQMEGREVGKFRISAVTHVTMPWKTGESKCGNNYAKK